MDKNNLRKILPTYLYGGIHEVVNTNFDNFSMAWLVLEMIILTPVRSQEERNCIHYSAWTAVEILLGQTVESTSSFAIASKRLEKAYMTIYEYWNKEQTLRDIGNLNIRREIFKLESIGYKDQIYLVKKALISGSVVILGLAVSVIDIDSGKHIKRHSIACMGYIIVSGEEYFVLRDTQNSLILGYKNKGILLLPVKGIKIEEIVLIYKK